jgi:MORN repeat
MMYVGECREGAFHGKGSLSTMGTRSVSYQGEWKKGVRHGRGIADYGNGQRYEGDFKEDKVGVIVELDCVGVSITGEMLCVIRVVSQAKSHSILARVFRCCVGMCVVCLVPRPRNL